MMRTSGIPDFKSGSINYRPESPDHGSMESNQVFPQGEV